MATVHQTQPNIQMLLATSDYVGALDLITATQDILMRDLAGIQSFRYITAAVLSQLLQMPVCFVIAFTDAVSWMITYLKSPGQSGNSERSRKCQGIEEKL